MIDLTHIPDRELLMLDERAQRAYGKSLAAVEKFPDDERLARCKEQHRRIAYELAVEIVQRLVVETEQFLGGVE